MPFDPGQPYEAAPSGFDPSAPYEAAGPSAYAKSMADQRAPGRWDILGDTGRVAVSNLESIRDDAAKLMPMERENRARENVRKFGPVIGTLKDALVDTPAEALGLAKIPLSAMGAMASPLTGGIGHGVIGSALSYLPGMDKQSADALVDKASMFAAPETMELGLSGAGRMSDMIKGAPQRAAADTSAANDAARSANPEFARARDAGYVIHPADAVDTPGVMADATSGLGGKIKTQQAASVKNQEVTNKIAAQELGLPADAVLDEKTFATVRKNAGKAYKVVEDAAGTLPRGAVQSDTDFTKAIDALDDVGHDLRRDFPELGENPDIATLQKSLLKPEFSPRAGVEAIKSLRFKAQENLKAIGNPEKKQLGMAQRGAATALEELMDRRLAQAGNPQALSDYRAARQMIAKSHDIESVTDAAGNVDARALSRLGDKRPFTGGLKTIADTAERFPKSMQMPSRFGGAEKHSVLDWMTTLGSAGVSGAGAWMHDPMVALSALPLATAPLLARPLARSAALSEWMQNRLLGLRKKPGNMGPMLQQGMAPAIGGQNALRNMLAPAAPAPIAQPQQQ